ncbi:hypothetical protein F991_01685 [Acinetobacter sp. CIP-A165]|uniref:hypothetical protein n=1 Tax=Acinetobacter sp. CIP-A165 TaxID=40373 RepID=UPI0002CF357E|nr:hypothetical protein [Acinetobacter sp. CIP-A165]ENU30293.1 hypothetical protein F991_01685 [Acinetobacter sp. CIP-A165]
MILNNNTWASSCEFQNQGKTNMHLIEIEPYLWELYKDNEGIYLNVNVNNQATSWEKTIILDQRAIQEYLEQGRPFINNLACRIENSQIRNDYEKYYSYRDVCLVKKNAMLEIFLTWKKSSI